MRIPERAMPDSSAMLESLARKYVWWKTPEEAMTQPERIIARVMDIGDYGDVQRLADLIGEAGLRKVLMNAEAGQFSARSWAYWHYRLQRTNVGQVPPLPARKTG